MVAAARSGGRRTFGHARMTSIDKMVHDLNLKPRPEDATKSENENEAEVEAEEGRESVPKEKSASSAARGVLEARDPNQRMGSKMEEYNGKTKKVRKHDSVYRVCLGGYIMGFKLMTRGNTLRDFRKAFVLYMRKRCSRQMFGYL
jgi:hypothetical protein